MASVARKSTGIESLDGLVQGGLKEKSITLLEGDAGSGKSTLAVHYLLAGIQAGENGVYVSVEESRESFFDNMGVLGFKLEDYEQSGNLIFHELNAQQLRDFLDKGVLGVEDQIIKVQAKRFVLDSISAFVLLYDTEAKQRAAVHKLFEKIRSWGLTSVVVSESSDVHSALGLQYQVDGWIRLYYRKMGQERLRTMEVLKMRGTKHEATEVVYRIEDGGIKLYPHERVLMQEG